MATKLDFEEYESDEGSISSEADTEETEESESTDDDEPVTGSCAYMNEPTYDKIPDITIDSKEILKKYKHRLESDDWCQCKKRCKIMPTGPECVCCVEVEALQKKLVDFGLDCITKHPDFSKACMDEFHLKISFINWRRSKKLKKIQGMKNRCLAPSV